MPASEGEYTAGTSVMSSLRYCQRWDTPQHALVDDDEGEDGVHIWPGAFNSRTFSYRAEHDVTLSGKDYSNPRVSDFHTLNKPFEDMYDRSTIPRMPWYLYHLKPIQR
jgi:phospholipase D1/2